MSRSVRRTRLTGHLGHVTLATGPRGALAVAGGARPVPVSPARHQRFPVVFDGLNALRRADDRFLADGRSMNGSGLFAVEASRRWPPSGITTGALMPDATHALDIAKARKSRGRHVEDCNHPGPNMTKTMTGVAAYALNRNLAAYLWQVSIGALPGRVLGVPGMAGLRGQGA